MRPVDFKPPGIFQEAQRILDRAAEQPGPLRELREKVQEQAAVIGRAMAPAPTDTFEDVRRVSRPAITPQEEEAAAASRMFEARRPAWEAALSAKHGPVELLRAPLSQPGFTTLVVGPDFKPEGAEALLADARAEVHAQGVPVTFTSIQQRDAATGELRLLFMPKREGPVPRI
jgi:hypothetical protein